jgi:hypothetical protein
MLSNRFWKTISRIFPGGALEGREDVIAKLNPEKIYVENVRSALGVSYAAAVRFCETAVRQGFFSPGIEVLCPDGMVAAAAGKEEDLPVTVHCFGEHGQEDEFPTKFLRRITFYRLNEQSASALHRTAAQDV